MMMAYPACPRLWFRYPCELSNPPLQQPNATRVRPKVGSFRDAAGCARRSSRPWYARR